MSTIIAKAAIIPHRASPNRAEFVGIVPGTYQRAHDQTPAQKAPQTSHFVIRKA